MKKYYLIVLCLFGFASPEIGLAAPMSFKLALNGGNNHTCCWIIAEGEITSETPRAFREYLNNKEPGELGLGEVRLNGFGENIDAAIELGKLFRKYKAETIIGTSLKDDPWYKRRDGGKCVGSCILAFLGGTRRVVSEGNSLTIGQFLTLGDEGDGVSNNKGVLSPVENQILTGKIVDYMVDMGIDPKLYALSVSVPPSIQSRPLTEQELRETNVENAKDLAGAWRAEVENDGLVAVIDTKIEGRSLSIYCSKSKGYILSATLNGTFEEDLIRLSEFGVKYLKMITDDGEIIANIKNVKRALKNTTSMEFAVNSDAAKKIAKSTYVDVWGANVELMRTWYDFVAQTFSFRDIKGDERLPLRVLEVCQK